MEFILNVVIGSIGQVWVTLLHNWPYLVASVVIATLLKLYVNTQKVSAFLDRYRGAGIVAATAAAVATPFCSCGTTAVILGMMASKMPWGPIVAFMVASPLTSPKGWSTAPACLAGRSRWRSTSPRLCWISWRLGRSGDRAPRLAGQPGPFYRISRHPKCRISYEQDRHTRQPRFQPVSTNAPAEPLRLCCGNRQSSGSQLWM
jgi:hypothetical protein